MDAKLNHGFPVEMLGQIRTPFYYYDMSLLKATLNELRHVTKNHLFKVHYAMKANGNPRITTEIAKAGLGADLVSGGEIKAALHAGFKPQMMAFSGVGKTDWEIRLGLEQGIGCFNVESVPELDNINQIAAEMGVQAPVAIRVNPNIDAHTHRYITTGTVENKFGIDIDDLPAVIAHIGTLRNVGLRGLHFHIGSQIVEMQPYVMLCETINSLLDHYDQQQIQFDHINVGGGLGINYNDPENHLIPDFAMFFNTIEKHLHLRPYQQLHLELGRSVVGQCGSLISRVVYVKESKVKKFVILDAGMSDLIRPALYQAHHEIQNLTSVDMAQDTYDVVGPICESSDVFAHDCQLPITRRGDLIAIRSAGAYGESMASTYNMRSLPPSFFH